MRRTLIGSGTVADVYEDDGRALKLFKADQPRSSAFREAANLALLEGSGLPVPEVFGVGRFGDRWGLSMSLVGGGCVADEWLGDDDAAAGQRALAALHARVHAHPGAGFPDLKRRLASSIGLATGLSDAHRSDLLRGLADLPDGDRLCHGDFHPRNVLGDGASATIIDWLDATCGVPAADICRAYVLWHGHSSALAREYVAVNLASASFTLADVLAWLPFVAAARLSENVTHDREQLIRWAAGGSCNLDAPA